MAERKPAVEPETPEAPRPLQNETSQRLYLGASGVEKLASDLTRACELLRRVVELETVADRLGRQVHDLALQEQRLRNQVDGLKAERASLMQTR
ncbi:MAG: hypothetical protein ACR2P5_04750 [Gammaproteobacteria bacterium]